jgi:hypothetical protein
MVFRTSMLFFVVVVVLGLLVVNGDLDLHWVWNFLLDDVRYLLFYNVWDWVVIGDLKKKALNINLRAILAPKFSSTHLNWIFNLLHDRHWDVLVDGVGLSYFHFHFIRHWFVDMHGHGTIVWDMDGVGHLLLHLVWDRLVDWHWVGFVDMDGIRTVNFHLNWVVFDLLNWVGLVDMHLHFDWVVHLLFHWVWGGHLHVNGHMHILVDGIGFGHVYFDWERFVNWYVDGVVLLLDHWVGGCDVFGHLDDFLDWVADLLDDWVWSGNLQANTC